MNGTTLRRISEFSRARTCAMPQLTCGIRTSNGILQTEALQQERFLSYDIINRPLRLRAPRTRSQREDLSLFILRDLCDLCGLNLRLLSFNFGSRNRRIENISSGKFLKVVPFPVQ